MNSWKSTGLSACAPPFSTFSIGVGSSVGVRARRGSGQRLVELGGLRAGDARARRRGSRWRRAAPWSSVPSSAISAWSRPAWSAASLPITAAAISPLTLATACEHALAAVGLAAVAQLDRLVLAGRGAGRDRCAAERPRFELTSTSTVGLPRLSKIWRAWTWAIALMGWTRTLATGAQRQISEKPKRFRGRTPGCAALQLWRLAGSCESARLTSSAALSSDSSAATPNLISLRSIVSARA